MTPTQGIIKFNEDRGLVDNYLIRQEYSMIAEEMTEFHEAIRRNDEHEMVDALADIIVVAIGALYKKGYNPDLVLKQTIKEISSRKGEKDRYGKFQKDKNQDPATLYKADYNLAKR